MAAGCGNGLVEPARGEACDDGNQLGGDGCNATCSSTGDCGNGQVDVGEECDCGTDDDALPPGCPAANGDTAAAACSLACTAHRCGNAGVDPGEACDDGNLIDGDGCASDCRSDETCGNGVRDAGEQCDDGNAVDGDGCQGWCALPSCGDGVVDGALGERCDDGNTDDVDGCASNCRSDESCGNGVPDFLAGEQCDDGDFQSQDGCSSGCQVESWTLSAATPAATPDTASVAVTAAYDAGRGVTMLYRSDAQDISETWTYDGAGWQLHVPATAPPPRYAPGLAYDAARSEVVMFGGYAGWALRETWTWDGTTWTQRLLPAASSPPNRGSTLMTYDARREQVLCFVGGTWGDPAELWAWDGEAWSQLAVGGPPGAYPDALAYDPIRDRVVLLGGYGTPGATQRVWEWNGATWAEATAAGGPAPDYDGAATFDTRLGAVVALRVWPTMIAWAWNGTSWAQVPSPTAPAAALATVAFDTRRGVAVSLPSFAADSASPDVWELDADGWHVASPYVPDMFFGEYQLVTVPWEAEVLLVGQRTDAWSGRGFTQRLPWGPNGYSPALAADVDRRWLLAVSDGGQVERLDANTWTEVVPASYDLSIGHSPATAYDAARGQLVMFGGNQSVGDTFVLVDDAWAVAATPDASPPARHAAAMAYDPVRERVVHVRRLPQRAPVRQPRRHLGVGRRGLARARRRVAPAAARRRLDDLRSGVAADAARRRRRRQRAVVVGRRGLDVAAARPWLVDGHRGVRSAPARAGPGELRLRGRRGARRARPPAGGHRRRRGVRERAGRQRSRRPGRLRRPRLPGPLRADLPGRGVRGVRRRDAALRRRRLRWRRGLRAVSRRLRHVRPGVRRSAVHARRGRGRLPR
jgi:cysteine-rich repeat protein